ncbi:MULTISPECIES: hypothetical protein [Bifidobacterium]|jgi:hypothetical protein|uniref:hypothetical protein n=1 Tax=Bifidobacterium TaxID=1678 RepID=UPI00114782AA|nr:MULTISPECIES: hypothetical protein [Bifidobacterium]QOL60160.1 hypothetical protein BL7055_06385 [Bifidobacterium longum subsp. longum]
MSTNKRERTIVDDVSAKILDRVINRAGMNNSAIDRASKSAIGYNRVRDIRNALKAPVRLSEFLLICEVCNADPVQTLREIITEARHMELEQQTATTKKSAGERFVVDESTSEPDWLSMAAKHGDIEAEQEAYEEMP